LVSVLSSLSVRAESFPYRAAVTADEVPVRSGPGPTFYATGMLGLGEEVEVYRREAGGWLAIRPPAGSFCWVEAAALQTTDQPQIAQVVGANAVAWIGSDLGDVEDHKWRVKLQAGEPVQLLSQGRITIYRGDEPREFCQIAPPAGDFRWLHEDALREPHCPASAEAEDESKVRPAQYLADEPSAASRMPVSTTAGSPDGFVPRGSSPSTVVPRVASLAPRPSFQPRAGSAADLTAWLKQLDLEFSLMAAKPPEEWRFAGLRRETEMLLDESQTTLHRGRARLLLEQLKEFEDLERRYAGLRAADPNAVPWTAAASDANAGAADELQPRFDGQGWLLPVHSTKQAAPPYALLDEEGRILTFVSPAPGLNLHRYLRKHIGVFGQRSQALFLDKTHLTADRVVDLERHRR